VSEHYPRIHEFAIGEVTGETPSDPTLVAILERSQRANADAPVGSVEEQLDPITGVVENHGKDDFTFSVQQSNDNEYPNPGDAYAGVNIRVNGASVANVVVKPGGRVAFALELATKKFIRLNATRPSFGRVTISHYFGRLTRRERKGVK